MPELSKIPIANIDMIHHQRYIRTLVTYLSKYLDLFMKIINEKSIFNTSDLSISKMSNYDHGVLKLLSIWFRRDHYSRKKNCHHPNTSDTHQTYPKFWNFNLLVIFVTELERNLEHIHIGIEIPKFIQRYERSMDMESFERLRLLRPKPRNSASSARRRRRVHQPGSSLL